MISKNQEIKYVTSVSFSNPMIEDYNFKHSIIVKPITHQNNFSLLSKFLLFH